MDQEQIDSTPNKGESAEEHKQSLRDSLTAALSGEEMPEEAEVKEEPEVKEENNETEEPSSEESQESNVPTEDGEEQEEVQQEEEKPLEALEAPKHWAKEFKERFEKLDPNGQHLFMSRYKDLEADYTKKTQNLAQYRKRNEALDEIYGPYKDDFQRAGMDEVAATRQLLAAHKYLKEDPKQALKWLANSYGVDLGEVTGDAPQDDEYTDPQIKSLQQQVAQLSGFIQNQQRTQQQNQVESTQSIIDQFAQAKDEQGNIKHPHFESLRDTMGVFINSGKAKDLDQAYEMAIYSDPKLRAEMIQEQVRAEQKKKVTTNAVKNAKKVQRSQVKGSATPASPGLPSGMSIKDTIDLTLKQLGA